MRGTPLPYYYGHGAAETRGPPRRRSTAIPDPPDAPRVPSRFDRAVAVTRNSLALAVVPAAASLLSGSKVARALSAGPGGGVTFPFPPGLPTLWTYVSLPNGPAGVGGGGSIGGPLSLVAFAPLFLLGLVVTSALEAGFLGALADRIEGCPIDFVGNARRFVLRMVGATLVRTAVVLVAAPLLVLPPLAVAVVLVLTYLVYGLPFEIVARDAALGTALRATVAHARDGGAYAGFGVAHLVCGGAASLAITGLVRNGGLPGVLLGAAVVAVPSVFVAVYGLLVFRELPRRPTSGR